LFRDCFCFLVCGGLNEEDELEEHIFFLDKFGLFEPELDDFGPFELELDDF